jgi:hypothetical protein
LTSRRGVHADPYLVLGIDAGADQRAVEQAYRRLCRRFHPDVSREPDAERRMREINAAYEILGDRSRRSQYERTRVVREPSAVQWAARRVWQESARPPAAPRQPRPPPRSEARVRISPGAVDFGFIARGHVATRTVKLSTDGPARLFTRGDWLSLDRLEIPAGLSEVTVTADPRDLHAFWNGPGAQTARVDGWIEVVDAHGTTRVPAGAILRRDTAASSWWNPFARRVS